MYKLITFAFTIIILSCNPGQDDDFQLFYQTFQGIMKEEPLMQALIEDRLFLDSFIVIPKKEEVQRILALSKAQLNTLHTFEITRLNPGLHKRYENLHAFLDLLIDKIALKKTYQTAPSFYSGLSYLEFLTTENNIEKLGKGLDQSVVLFQTAIKNLNPVNIEKLKEAIKEGTAVFDFLSNEVRTHIEVLNLGKEEKKEMLIKLTSAKLAVKNYIAFCNSKLFDLGEKS
ncbi:MAG: hypothetical protein ACI8P3_000309 [Saprospiraceae bacterium]|jgi:hypothetical protein